MRSLGRSAECAVVDSLDWPAAVLGSLGAEFEVVEPAELRDHLHRIGERFVRAGTPTR
jgi:hypothetical protein